MRSFGVFSSVIYGDRVKNVISAIDCFDLTLNSLTTQRRYFTFNQRYDALQTIRLGDHLAIQNKEQFEKIHIYIMKNKTNIWTAINEIRKMIENLPDDGQKLYARDYVGTLCDNIAKEFLDCIKRNKM